jgi:hypothetical protein
MKRGILNMKKIILTVLIAALLFAAFACSASLPDTSAQSAAPQAGEESPAESLGAEDPASDESFGSAGAAADDDLPLEEMLTYAIQDEYLARAEYEAIMEEYGSIAPFSNIIRAEESHISQLVPLFESNGLAVPADDAADYVILPASLDEAYQAGIDAEIANIAMYELFLAQELPDDVRAVFENLMAGSQSHLSAFENAASGGGAGSGNGAGNGGGNGTGNGLRDGSGPAA